MKLPLCRLRSGMLLPQGELEVAARGNRPGTGAVAALEKAGDNGSVLVAWEHEGRVHGIGVLARALPLPAVHAYRLPGGAPGGPALSGVARWKLRGVRRALIDPARVQEGAQEGEPPMIAADLLREQSEDTQLPPPAFLESLAELSRAWSGGDQWRDAFELMSRATLGQWSTSLCTLLPDELRFEALDHPERTLRVLRTQLDRLLDLQARRQLPE